MLSMCGEVMPTINDVLAYQKQIQQDYVALGMGSTKAFYQFIMASNAECYQRLQGKPALLAAMLGDEEEIKRLFVAGLDINYEIYGGFNALDVAVLANNESLIDTLSKIPSLLQNRHSLLLGAVRANHVELIKRALRIGGAYINVASSMAAEALRLAALYGRAEIIQCLLQAGVDVNADDGWQTALYIACEKGRSACVDALLAADQIDINKLSKIKVRRAFIDLTLDASPLWVAVKKNQVAIVEKLITAGVDINLTGAFEHAVKNNNLACVNAILQSEQLQVDIERSRSVLKFGSDRTLSVLLQHENMKPVVDSYGMEYLERDIDKNSKDRVAIWLRAGVLDWQCQAARATFNRFIWRYAKNERLVKALFKSLMHSLMPQLKLDCLQGAFVKCMKTMCAIDTSPKYALSKHFFIHHKSEILDAIAQLPDDEKAKMIEAAYDKANAHTLLYQIFHTSPPWHRKPAICRGNLKRLHGMHQQSSQLFKAPGKKGGGARICPEDMRLPLLSHNPLQAQHKPFK